MDTKNTIMKRRKNSTLIFVILIVVMFLSMWITEYNFVKGLTSFGDAFTWTIANFLPDAASLEKLPGIMEKLFETILMSIAATTIAAICALFFSLLGSKTTKVNGFLSVLSRGVATLFRNIPVAAWSLILLFSFAQSSLTGLFALFFVSFGFLTRVFMETIDEVSSSSVEALRATGAPFFTIIFQSVIPSCLPQMVSWILFEIETNIRNATLVGILTGTGIGFAFDLYYKGSDYNVASLIVIVIVLTVFLIEYVSNSVRRIIL
jgi:phosphonate transport system permease protein